MDGVTPLPTLSQMRHWDTQHLIQAADDWEAEAQHWESTYEQNYRRLAETDWQGQAREAALERAGLDLVKVRGPAGQLAEAALAARYGYDQQNGAKEWALDAVTDAHQAGFKVSEDLTVTDTQTGGSAAQRAVRQAQAQALSAQIRHRAALLVASNQEIAAKITAAAGNIGAFSFDEPTGAGGQSGRQHNGAVRPVANRTVANASPAANAQPPRADVSNDQWNLGTVQQAVPPAPTVDKAASPPPAASPSPAVSGGRPASWLPTTRAGGSPLPGSAAGASAGTVGAAQSGSAAGAGAGIAASSAGMGTGAISTAATAIGAPAAATPMAQIAQPLAHTQTQPAPSEPPATRFADPGQALHAHTPYPPASTPPPPPQPLVPPTPAAPPEPANPPPSPPPAPHIGTPTPATAGPAPSAGAGGIQLLGFGPPGPAQPPQAPHLPTPRDPQPPVPPPPPPQSPGAPPLQRPDVSGWVAPPRAPDAQKAQKNLQDLEDAIKRHNDHPPNTSDPNAVALYNSEANYYNWWAAQLEGEVESWNADYTPASQAQTINTPNTPSWAQPAPELPQAPTGQHGSPMRVAPGTNAPATIDGVPFSGHAIDEMQSDGIPFSAVNRALHVGAIESGKYGRTTFYDAANNISVVQDPDGMIVTVSYGHLHG